MSHRGGLIAFDSSSSVTTSSLTADAIRSLNRDNRSGRIRNIPLGNSIPQMVASSTSVCANEPMRSTGHSQTGCQSRKATDAMARDLFSVFISTRCQPFSRMVA